MVGSLASSQFINAYSVYLILISWSVVAETFVFSTSPIFKSSNNNKRPKFSVITLGLAKDPLVILSLILLNIVYFNFVDYNVKSALTLILIACCLTVAFFLRIAEASTKALCSRDGKHVAQQFIVNNITSIKMLGIIVCIYLDSEILIYMILSIISFACIHLLLKKTQLNLSEYHKAAQPEKFADRWLVLLSLLVGTFSFQLDKLLALNGDDQLLAARYIVLYSLVFIILQGLTPLYNRYISNLWVDQKANSISADNKIWFKNVVQILTTLFVLVNVAVVFTSNLYFYDSVEIGILLLNLSLLSVSVLVVCSNTFSYYDFLSKALYKPIFWMSLSGLLSGTATTLVLFSVNSGRYYAAVPLSVAIGTFFYLRSWKVAHDKNPIANLNFYVPVVPKHQISNCIALLFCALLCYLLSQETISVWNFLFLYIGIVFLNCYLTCLQTKISLFRSVKLIFTKDDEYI